MIEVNEQLTERYGSRATVGHLSFTAWPGQVTGFAAATVTQTDAVADRNTRGSE